MVSLFDEGKGIVYVTAPDGTFQPQSFNSYHSFYGHENPLYYMIENLYREKDFASISKIITGVQICHIIEKFNLDGYQFYLFEKLYHKKIVDEYQFYLIEKLYRKKGFDSFSEIFDEDDFDLIKEYRNTTFPEFVKNQDAKKLFSFVIDLIEAKKIL